MQEREDRGERFHERVWSLIPWYVNGTLPQRERERVEDHLEVCPRCQEEERACRRTAEILQGAGEVAPTPHPVQLQRILARVEETEREERTSRISRISRISKISGAGAEAWRLPSPFRALIEATPRALRGALVAQVAIIILLAGVLVWQELHSGPQGVPAPAVYRTLSDAAPARRPVLRLRVMFSPQATERQVRELLLDLRGEITGGPSPLGVYTVEVPAGRDSLQVVLARLRSESQVMLAEPAAGEETR
jgi:anti-sigma factor RsiW